VSTVARRAAHQQVDQSERAWWLRAVAVLQSPAAVFSALRDDSTEAAAARQEPVTAIVILAGIAGVLAGPTTGRLFDDYAIDGVTAAIIIFLSGGVYGLVAYLLGGGALQLASSRLGSRGTYRRSKHVLAYAAVPIALSLPVLWPVEFALFGGDLLRSGGRDTGVARDVFLALELAFVAWTAGLLVVGVRAVHGWTWARAVAASSLAAAIAAGLLALLVVVLTGA
jgi:hypothetical protein